METRYKKIKTGTYDVIEKSTGKTIGRVRLKKRTGEWVANFKKVGIVCRYADTRAHATKMGVSLYESEAKK